MSKGEIDSIILFYYFKTDKIHSIQATKHFQYRLKREAFELMTHRGKGIDLIIFYSGSIVHGRWSRTSVLVVVFKLCMELGII